MLRPIQSESIDKIAAALVSAQSAVQHAEKDSSNPHFNSRYTSLTAVHDACQDALRAASLAVTQQPFPFTDVAGNPLLDGQGKPAGFILRTVLMHESGQFIASELPMGPNMAKPQEVGSAMTYARRYGLAAMLGVCPEDDDAEAATAPYRNGNGHRNGNGYRNGNGQRAESRAPAQPSKPKDERSYGQLVADAAAKLCVHAATLNREIMDEAVEAGVLDADAATAASKKGSANEIVLMTSLFERNRKWVIEALRSRFTEAAAEREAIQSA